MVETSSKVVKNSAKVIKKDIDTVLKVSKTHGSGFMDFIREQGIVGLAVGLAIGTSVGSTVKAIVDNFINPLVGFIVGGLDLSQMKWNVISFGNSHHLVIGWGAIISSMITLLATAFVVYQIVHVLKLDRLDKKKEETKEEPTDKKTKKEKK